MAKVELRNLTKVWDQVTAVDGIDLEIRDGEFLAVLGPSGCGKSTTLFMLAGVYLPSGGDILFDGARVNDVEARSRNVGIVFQSYALYPNMNVLQNIMFPLRFQDTEDAPGRAREMAELVQVGELLERRPSQLSGGQQQRVALARALVKQPNLLLLDEPLSNLDATLRLTMRAEIRRITRELEVTTILVTHDQLEATTMADRVVCMSDGSIEQIGTAEDLYLRPDTLFVAGFIGSPPINLVKLQSRQRALLDVSDAAETVGIRPELLHSSETGLPVAVTTVEPMGRETLVTADSELGRVRFLEATSRPKWSTGDKLRVSFQQQDTIVFDSAGQRMTDSHAAIRNHARA